MNRTDLLVLSDPAIHPPLQPVLDLVAPRRRELLRAAEVLQAAWLSPPALLLIESAGRPDLAIGLLGQLRPVFQFPVLVVEEGASEGERIALLDGGADDVLRLGRGMGELPARCATLLRRRARQIERNPDALYLCAGQLRLDIPGRRLLLPDNSALDLSLSLTRLLAVLCSRQGHVVTAEELRAALLLSGPPAVVQRRLAGLVKELHRRATARLAAPVVERVPGRGYRLVI